MPYSGPFCPIQAPFTLLFQAPFALFSPFLPHSIPYMYLDHCIQEFLLGKFGIHSQKRPLSQFFLVESFNKKIPFKNWGKYKRTAMSTRLVVVKCYFSQQPHEDYHWKCAKKAFGIII